MIAPTWNVKHVLIPGGKGKCNVTSQSSDLDPGNNYWGYGNQVLIYDTQERLWGGIEASSTDPHLLGPNGECGPFPINVCLPQVSVRGNKIAVVGGEADERMLHGHQYGHDSDFAVVGTMSVI